jgi:hypothetical protein
VVAVRLDADETPPNEDLRERKKRKKEKRAYGTRGR